MIDLSMALSCAQIKRNLFLLIFAVNETYKRFINTTLGTKKIRSGFILYKKMI